MNTANILRTVVVRLLAVVGFVLPLLVVSCASPQDIPGAMRLQGIIRYVKLEGGCWVIEVGNDIRSKKLYELTGKDLPEVSINDAEVTVWVVLKADAVSTCQVGQVAEIIDVVDVKEPRKK